MLMTGPDHLEVRHLRLVAAIADAGGMTKASGVLHLSQSALSHQLRDIEDRLGAELFLRVGRRLTLTPAGERVLASARRVLDDLRQTEQDVHDHGRDDAGVIRVCTQCNTGYHWLPPLMTVFSRRHPRVTINIVADATDQPVQALVDGRIDLAVLTAETDDSRVRLRRLFDDEMVAIVSRDHRLAGRSWILPRDLATEHVLVYSSRPKESFALTRILGPAGVTPARVSYVMLTEALVEMSRAGVGVAIVPRWPVHRAIAERQVAALSFGRKGIHRTWTAATLKAQRERRFTTDFIDLLAEGPGAAKGARRTA